MTTDTANPEKIYLEDIKLGDTFTSDTYTLTTEDIKTFAQQYDPQYFHLDEVAAKDSFFQGLAASGWQTAGITMRLMVASIPMAAGLIGAGGTIAWPSPTRAGDTLHVVATVIDIAPSKSKPDRGIVTVQINTLKQDNTPAQTFTCQMLAFRRPTNS